MVDSLWKRTSDDNGFLPLTRFAPLTDLSHGEERLSRGAIQALTVLAVLLGTAGGCAQAPPTRDPYVDAHGPVVNPLAPGARVGLAGKVPVATGPYVAREGMNTGTPK
jgi:hypothetical protein